ncbi:MAG: hypothetical protein H7039_06515 [Bryobacteraceae bacterium]|nr:hypothetical protein [Bryobacteraceae bacterium]
MENSVVLTFELGSEMGTQEERNQIHAFEEELIREFDVTGAGMFDGDEFGNGACTVFCYGDSLTLLWEAVERCLSTMALPRYVVVKRSEDETIISD